MATSTPRMRLIYARNASDHLRAALRMAKGAEAPQLVKRIKAALSSAEGAVRHAQGRVDREAVAPVSAEARAAYRAKYGVWPLEPRR